MNIFLADYYHESTKRLIQSLSLASINFKTVVIHYDGDLSTEFYSPFTYFTGWHSAIGSGLFFNEIKVSPLYEIRHQNSLGGNIFLGDFIVGKFHYFKNTQRIVKQVDWLDRKGLVVTSDCYSIQGFKYAIQLYSTDKKVSQKIFLNEQGDEVIHWNLEVGTVQLNNNHKIVEFANLTEFTSHFIRTLQHSGEIKKINQLFINSLSFPLFVANACPYQTTLFWQEFIKNDIPQNMVHELVEKRALTKIMFESEEEYTKVSQLHSNSHVQLNYLSPLEKFERVHRPSGKALILTKSDQLHHIEEILDSVPNLKLTIAAPTNMSQKLYDLQEKYPSISLLPSVSEKDIATLLEMHDIYLDINAGSEVDNCIYRAYCQKYLIIGFEEVAKNPRYALLNSSNEYLKLIELLQNGLNPKFAPTLVNKLERKHGPKSTIKQYKKYLNPHK
ncbi:hypothetical protein [Listeria monocytogenes]|uniref:hypothetical protein n=1 Tax=Listeria monocytogenes TaxID=1639 RepID=UPI001E3DCFD1|nr:hypothetical protein [Listeria monocytogenes]MCD2249347.1 hypothetical protein [Listeria monocytogenes]